MKMKENKKRILERESDERKGNLERERKKVILDYEVPTLSTCGEGYLYINLNAPTGQWVELSIQTPGKTRLDPLN